MPARRTLASALSILLLIPEAASAQPDAGPPPSDGGVSSADGPAVRVVRVRDLLLRAIRRYHRSEFDGARTLLVEILGYVGKERSRTAQEAYTYLAFVHVAYGETELAVEAFEKALAIKPDLQLEAPAPRIASVFEQALRRFRAKVRALDHDPPTLIHTPPPSAAYGKPVVVEVQASDVSGVKRVVVNHRIVGNRGFSSVKLERDGRGRFVATIPGVAVMRPGVEYYVEAWDALGNGPGLKGSAAKPIIIKVRGGPRASPASGGPTPWYKQWWVWAIASGVIVAAGGAGIAAYMNREETARVDVNGSVALNPAGGK